MIGCFGDPGLEALRALARAACLRPCRSLDSRGRCAGRAVRDPHHRQGLGRDPERAGGAGLGPDPFVGVFAAEGTGLDAARDADAVAARLHRLAGAAVAAGARTLILGGAALAGFAARVEPEGAGNRLRRGDDAGRGEWVWRAIRVGASAWLRRWRKSWVYSPWIFAAPAMTA